MPDSENRMTLEELVSRLNKSSNVDALAITGSAGLGETNPSSDYDLLIVVTDNPSGLMSGATFLDGRFTDLGFVTTEEIREIIETGDNRLLLNGPYTTMIRSIQSAKISFDKSGQLTALQNKYQGELSFIYPEEGELLSRLDKASYNLAHTKRYISSDNPDYLMAADLRMLYQLENLMVDYFFVRGRPWPGEKQAVRHWRSNDPDYYTLFRKCLYETDREKRVNYYEQLAVATMKPVGDLWHTGETRFRMKSDNEMGSENQKIALRFWESLLGI